MMDMDLCRWLDLVLLDLIGVMHGFFLGALETLGLLDYNIYDFHIEVGFFL